MARRRQQPADSDRPEAIALEDEEPLAYIGEEAYAPLDTGRGPAPADIEPPELTEADEPLEAPLP
jgi:hypothetical protein